MPRKGLSVRDGQGLNRTGKGQQWRLSPYLFVMPVMLSLGFLFYNVGLVIYESLREHKFAFPQFAQFNNLGNFKRLFLSDPMIGPSLLRSFVWVAGTVSIAFVLGFILALLLNQRFWGRAFYRAAILTPWAISGIVSVMTWSWILNGNYLAFSLLYARATRFRAFSAIRLCSRSSR